MYIRLFLFVYHSVQVMKKKKIEFIIFYFLQRTLYRLFPKIWRRNTWKQDKNGRTSTGWQNMNTTTVTFSLISFSSSQFYFYIFFFSPSYLSLSFAPSFFYHYFDQPQAFLKLLWRRSDNTIHSLFYLAMALSSFRPVLKKFF